jgi:hypothetical protein
METEENIPRREYLAKLRAFKKQFTQNIVTTRFNESTWQENIEFRKKYTNVKCIYCTPTTISRKIPSDSILFVLEMNNTKNKIMGIGLIKNHPYTSKYSVYENNNYNRYNYVGRIRIDRTDMDGEEIKIIDKLDQLCFRGTSHVKRGHGITALPIQLLYKHKDEYNFHELIRQMFKKRMEVKNI